MIIGEGDVQRQRLGHRCRSPVHGRSLTSWSPCSKEPCAAGHMQGMVRAVLADGSESPPGLSVWGGSGPFFPPTTFPTCPQPWPLLDPTSTAPHPRLISLEGGTTEELCDLGKSLTLLSLRCSPVTWGSKGTVLTLQASLGIRGMENTGLYPSTSLPSSSLPLNLEPGPGSSLPPGGSHHLVCLTQGSASAGLRLPLQTLAPAPQTPHCCSRGAPQTPHCCSCGACSRSQL